MTPIDPFQQDGNALLEAVQWCAAVAQGPAMTSIATVAIACIGVGMLGGRIPTRRGLTAVLGCFILFGAPSISLGLMSAASGMGGATYPNPMAEVVVPQPQPVPPQPQPVPPPSPPAGDPYAGASVPSPPFN